MTKRMLQAPATIKRRKVQQVVSLLEGRDSLEVASHVDSASESQDFALSSYKCIPTITTRASRRSGVYSEKLQPPLTSRLHSRQKQRWALRYPPRWEIPVE